MNLYSVSTLARRLHCQSTIPRTYPPLMSKLTIRIQARSMNRQRQWRRVDDDTPHRNKVTCSEVHPHRGVQIVMLSSVGGDSFPNTQAKAYLDNPVRRSEDHGGSEDLAVVKIQGMNYGCMNCYLWEYGVYMPGSDHTALPCPPALLCAPPALPCPPPPRLYLVPRTSSSQTLPWESRFKCQEST